MSLWALADSGLYVGIGIGALVLVLIIVFAITFSRKSSAPTAARQPCGGCARPMLPEWERCLFCGWVPPPPTASLEFICGPLVGRTVSLDADVTTVGSIGGNSIVLADPAVSRKHMGIKRAGRDYELADLGSSNGVYVNGQRTAKRILVSGDIIRIGTSEMVFRASKVG